MNNRFKLSKPHRRDIIFCSIIVFIFLLAGIKKSYAWVYPEHRQIALLAIQHLSVEQRSQMEKLWSEARIGYTGRLTELVIEPTQGLKPKQLDFASWTAIAGDHSCSPENLMYNVLQTEWILSVADIAAQLNMDIANAKSKSSHINAIRNSDIRLQRADAEYATRAGSNNVHFLLSRPEIKTTIENYLTACFAKGAALNALGAYGWFHMSALLKATRYANENLPAAERAALMLAALADEAFALHFLEDVYAAGHIAGTWGNASQRKGTHDYYNEHGLEVVSWNGERTINMGDAYMLNKDAEAAAVNVRQSLEQLLAAAAGKLTLDYKSDAVALINLPDSFNVCRNNFMPLRQYDVPLLGAILKKTPVPGLATGYGELPRFRAELGMFLGISASLNGSTIFGGFGKQQTDHGGQGGIEGNIRFGFGLDGVLNEAGDGLVFLEAGWRQDGASTNKFINTNTTIVTNSLSSAIPGRRAYNLRLRMPFWLIPGDLLIAGPILLLTSKQKLQEMAVTAGNGGLIPWQSGMATRIGRFQFVLGREVGLSFYGLGNTNDALIIPQANADSSYLLEYRSTKIDFPILEYRPFRTFSQDQSSSMMVQLNAGVDIPSHIKVTIPEGRPAPATKSYWYVGVKILFNWRHYY
jgi:hypothetical protein